MLKITITETPTERRWVVEGRLVGSWVRELRTTWSRTHRSQDGRACIVDLDGVTSIDSRGQAALMAMIGQGARLTAKGVYNGYLVKELMNKARRHLLHGGRTTEQT
jgi:anti-anti-sigma regulatory factor